MGIDQMSKMNENIGERNRYQKAVGNRRLVQKFSNNELCKFIGCVLSEGTYCIKGHQIWGKPKTSVSKKEKTPLKTHYTDMSMGRQIN